MLNQTVIVGRIEEIFPDEIILKCPKIQEDYDLIPVTIVGTMMDNVREYCSKGDIVGVKGKLESEGLNVKVKAEKVTFLSSKRHDESSEGGEE